MMNFLGNKEILNSVKIGFLCSRKIPAEIILKTYDWAIKKRDEGKCIISGFHSKIEKDVFHFLLKGTQPLIMVLARGLLRKWDKKYLKEIDRGRLLVITPFKDEITRITSKQAYKRNQLILELADEIYTPYISKDSSINELIKQYESKYFKTIKI